MAWPLENKDKAMASAAPEIRTDPLEGVVHRMVEVFWLEPIYC